MFIFRAAILFLLLACSSTAVFSQPAHALPTPQPQKRTESFWQILAGFFGIGSNPDKQKGPEDELKMGRIWVLDLQQNSIRSVTSGGGYRSPVFMRGDQEILAVRGDKIVKVRLQGGTAQELFTIKGIVKIVGSSKGDQNPEQVLVLINEDGGGCPIVGLLSLASGEVTPVLYGSLPGDKILIDHLLDWRREYDDGNFRFDIQEQERQTSTRTIRWTDIFLNRNNQNWTNISRCDGIRCGQPSLSHNRNLVVFVKDD
jgi:hypothetical protein